MTSTTRRLLETELWELRSKVKDGQESLACAMKHRANCEIALKRAQNSEIECATRAQAVSDKFDELLSDYKSLGGTETFSANKR